MFDQRVAFLLNIYPASAFTTLQVKTILVAMVT